MKSFSSMAKKSQSSPQQLSSLHNPKAKWSPDEDEMLLQVIQDHGPSDWNSIATSLPGRTGKQCRERWISKLSPAYTSEPWTKDEDQLLIRLQSELGNQWSKFRSSFPHRSTISIKNRWISIKRRETRQRNSSRVSDGSVPNTLVETEQEQNIVQVADFDITDISSMFDSFLCGVSSDGQDAFDDLAWFS
jgi:hypothetical protein